MALDDYKDEQDRGSIIPGIAGSAIAGGATGLAIHAHQNNKGKKQEAVATSQERAQGIVEEERKFHEGFEEHANKKLAEIPASYQPVSNPSEHGHFHDSLQGSLNEIDLALEKARGNQGAMRIAIDANQDYKTSLEQVLNVNNLERSSAGHKMVDEALTKVNDSIAALNTRGVDLRAECGDTLSGLQTALDDFAANPSSLAHKNTLIAEAAQAAPEYRQRIESYAEDMSKAQGQQEALKWVKGPQGLNVEAFKDELPIAELEKHKASLTGLVSDTERAMKGAEVQSEWDRLVNNRMKNPGKITDDGTKGLPKEKAELVKQDVKLANAREKQLHTLNNRVHDLRAKVNNASGPFSTQHLRPELEAAEKELHGLASEHIAHTKGLGAVVQEAEEVAKTAGKGGWGKVIGGGIVAATLAGVATQALFGRAERPRNSHAARIRAEQAAVAQQRGMQA